ncbi:glycosyltransferase family 4 protein [Natronoarchaeum rubrum]|uniref:glycosyltransferase family 4 protein n=1 Tax=Natronoarchaeum rubrum TaxID=755311 RepID=UPI002111B144|nr:glycosyltransferase family 4 protein [Natronoarchaeum rubrum]
MNSYKNPYCSNLLLHDLQAIEYFLMSNCEFVSVPIRAVFFHIGSESFGGGSQMLWRLLQRIDRDKFDPVVLTQRKDKLSDQAENASVDVEIVPFKGILDSYNKTLLQMSTFNQAKASMRLLQFNLEAFSVLSEADVIWCHNIRALFTISPYAILSQTPVIWNIGLGLESDGVLTYLNEIGLWLADVVFMEYEEQAEQVFTERQYSKFDDEFVFFHKGIDVSSYSPTRSPSPGTDTTVIGTAAVLSERKGLQYLIDAVATLQKNGKDIELRIAGESPDNSENEYEQKLRTQIQKNDLGDSIRLLGWVEDMPSFFDELDVFVLPSFGEGIPGAVREALAMERPVVATDVGGTSEVVQDGQTGILVEPGNANAIADAVERIVDEPERAVEMGQSGHELIVREHSVDSYVERYESLLASLVDE